MPKDRDTDWLVPGERPDRLPDQPVPYGQRVRSLAEQHPEAIAIITVGRDGSKHAVSWRDLEEASNRAARLLADRGVDHTSFTVVGLPNGFEHFVWTIGAWKLGALVLALNPKTPLLERNEILELAQPAAIVSDWADTNGVRSDAFRAHTLGSDPILPDRVAHPARAVASGGSTGRPKIIVLPEPMAAVPGHLGPMGEASGMTAGQTQLVVGPLYHNMPNGFGYTGLFHDHQLVVMARFDAELAVDLIEQHKVNFAAMVPTHMSRIAKLDDIGSRDLSSIHSILHSAAVCPPWLKRRWFELLAPSKVYEGFGATEDVGHTAIRGDEWLMHPGSVGRPRHCDLKILDDNGTELAAGEVGEIFMRRHADDPTYAYLGATPAKTTEKGFVSVGDLGWVDEQGYLYIADRRVDLIITGGSNVYPAEVEAAIAEHPAVADVVVIGLTDADWGRRVHALVQIRDGYHLSEEGLRDMIRGRLAAYKTPKTYEFVDSLPRDDAGKIRRSTLMRARDEASRSTT